MIVSKSLQKLLGASQENGIYWAERVKLEFARSLEVQRRKVGMSYAQLAQALGTSAAYISKVFRGDSNMTIESMAKLAHAARGRIEISVVPVEAAIVPWAPPIARHSSVHLRIPEGAFTQIDCAVNDHSFAIAA